MTTFVLIHGGGDVGWSWHLVQAELEARGHRVVAPDLPADDETLTLDDDARAVRGGRTSAAGQRWGSRRRWTVDSRGGLAAR